MNDGTSMQWNTCHLSERGTLCTVWNDGQDILNEKRKLQNNGYKFTSFV